MTEFAWDPDSYLALMAAEIPDYRRLQAELTAAVTAHDRPPQTVLDLGIGSGLTAKHVLDSVPHAQLLGIDASAETLAAAARTLDPDRTELRRGPPAHPLPPAPSDLATAALAIHLRGGPGKADLFARIAEVLPAGGRFGLADLIVPTDPAEAVTPIDGVEDTPSTLDEQLDWLAEAGLATR